MKNKLETGECLLVAQEGKGKSDLWKTFYLVVETTENQEKLPLREFCVWQTGAARLQYYIFL